MATTLLGPLLPLLASRWALSDASAGALFTAQFAGQLSSTTLSTVLTARLGEQRTLALGFALVAVGVAAVGVVPASLGWLAVLTYGLGLGCVLPVTNILVAALAPARAASALSLVNVSWGIGAMVWPLVVTALTGVHPAGPTMLLAVASTAVGVTWLAVPAIEGRRGQNGPVDAHTACGCGARAGRGVVCRAHSLVRRIGDRHQRLGRRLRAAHGHRSGRLGVRANGILECADGGPPARPPGAASGERAVAAGLEPGGLRQRGALSQHRHLLGGRRHRRVGAGWPRRRRDLPAAVGRRHARGGPQPSGGGRTAICRRRRRRCAAAVAGWRRVQPVTVLAPACWFRWRACC